MTGPLPARRPRSLEEAADARRLDCARTNACLALAEAQGWPAFTCIGCDGYAPPDPAQRARDVTGLMLITALAGGYSVDASSEFEKSAAHAAHKEPQ